MAAPRVVVAVPRGWRDASFDRPIVAESTGARIEAWHAWRSPGGEAGLVAGCVATPIPGWVEDMRPGVEARTVALAGAAAAKITGAPVDARPARPAPDGLFDLRAASHVGGPVLGSARTFIGFDAARVFTCFAACATKTADTSSGCEGSVDGASLEASAPPPAPGFALRFGAWAVHHPKPTASAGAAAVVVVGALLVLFRRRPRFRAAVR